MNMFEQGIKNIWDKDSEMQIAILTELLQKIRKVPEEQTTQFIEYLRELGAFFVIDDEYMIKHFGADIAHPNLTIYMEAKYCTLYERLAIPLRWLDGTIFGFVGYGIDGDQETKYLYPPKRIFSKAQYMFITPQEMSKAIADGNILITDGIFDKISLTINGYNAVALGSSYITPFHRLALSTVKHKIIVPDNDQAGAKMAKMGRRLMEGTVTLTQSKEWDIDDFLKVKGNLAKLHNTMQQMKREGFLLSKIII